MSAPAVIPWHRPDVRAAVLDVAESLAADAFARGYAAGAADATERFWAGVEFQRAYETRCQDLAAQAGRPDYPTLLDRRGEHGKAAAYRAEYTRRGLPVTPPERAA